MIRIQIYYSKGGAFRYTGNLDVHKAWERIFRRANLSLAYSQGFHPQPRLNQANPLPLGITGRNELIEVWINNNQINHEEIRSTLEKSLPPGITINAIEEVPLNAPSPQTRVIAADYVAEISPAIAAVQLKDRIQTLLQSESLIRERRGKKYDLRPLVYNLELENSIRQAGNHRIFMRLAAGQQATGRPDEVLTALGLDPFSAYIERTGIVFRE
ncbi:MAG: DUF2344 domain-containing protein [Anaerolineae bacterium]|nr:DUF2344 domain-containing protein [Anaerolineae bacterium]